MIAPVNRVVVRSSPAFTVCKVNIEDDPFENVSVQDNDTEAVSIREFGMQNLYIKANAIQYIGVSAMGCAVKEISPKIAKGADKIFQMNGQQGADYSGATEIQFLVKTAVNGTTLLTKTLTGGDISLIDDNSFSFEVSSAESTTIGGGNKYCVAWVTISSGERRCVGAGTFCVEDTGGFPA